MTAPAPLDLGKPMRWKNGKTVTVVHHGKAGAALKTEGAQWPHWYTPTELDELFENISPEPPKPGPTDTECANILHYSALVCANHLDPKDDVPRSEQFAMVRRWFADVTARIEREGRR